ncbi:hypothetical protein BST81_13580 [Leptolyngbya sp. 'hensonii']|uniref:phosphate-starvation-inducible PsiE family protein n=1 Tax=Leptolyngbya sp. 'hensonii' TaxID=1922337 RepID=UPI00094F949B|nr:phosphate-starvation-inducible PsiE family protein [Leptolyngbya sp. 'hensonii']OLP18055.1 hypothetical protein BST81_13580 [Leptolyngbya sp. 'hensonii']
MWLNKLINFWGKLTCDDSFIKLLSQFEKLVSRLLSIGMIVVILVALYDLGYFLVQEIATPPFGFNSITLIEIFGLFLNILIALEILENITGYLKEQVIQVELVIVTSLIAVARKIIILDFQKTTGIELIGLAIAIASLAFSYWLIHRTNRQS